MRNALRNALAALSILALPGLALGQAAGTALGVDPQAVARAKAVERVLVVGADVALGERIVTGDSGLVQIRFTDSTELTVGPGSSLLIEDYLLRGDQTVGKFTVNALAGTFRFVTGKSAKDAYEIKTPTGTIGVRGTAFDFAVPTPKRTDLLLFNGAVELCSKSGQCVVLTKACAVGVMTASGAESASVTDENRRALRAEFPWAVSEADLLRNFWVAGARKCLNRAIVDSPRDSLASPGGPGEAPSQSRNNR